MIRKVLVLGAAAFLTAGAAVAGDAKVGDIAIQGAWARASAGPVKNGAAFMTIHNAGNQADRIVAAASEASATTELHTHVKDGEVMRMRQVEAIDLPAGATVKLEPGGLHVMFLGLKAPLQQGASFPVTLKFASGAEATVGVDVLAPGAMGMAGAMDHGQHMQQHQTQHGKH